MKRNRLLLMLMLALLVPALALSGCDNKKKKSRDKDDDESTEKSEKKNIDIAGVYELDEESAKMILGNDSSTFVDGSKVKCELNLGEDKDMQMVLNFEVSTPIPDINNTLLFKLDVTCTGWWKYDKKDKLLTVDIKNAELTRSDISFAKDDDMSRAVIKELGDEEKIKEEIKNEFNPGDLCNKGEFKVTELTDFGFYARTTTGKSQKVKFIRKD